MRRLLVVFGLWVVAIGCSAEVQVRTQSAAAPAAPTPVPATTAAAPPPPEMFVEDIEFDSARAQIRERSRPVLDDLAGRLLADPTIARVDIDGHADAFGTPERNLDLSTRRAREVRLYLIKKGIDPSRLVARGFGEARPISDNVTAGGRQYNRRVEFTVYRQSTKIASAD